jgi:ABC-type arginine transport system permease subunit
MMGMMSQMMGGGHGGENCGCGMHGMMSGTKEGGQGMGMPAMPHMMMHMMPHCLHMMLPGVPREQRVDFLLNMITALMEQGSAGMSEEEKSEFVARVLEKVTS